MVSPVQFLSVVWMLPFVLMEIMGIFGMLFLKKSKPVKQEPGVSFIVAVWNEGGRAAKCINSILSQNYPAKKIKVILIGGGDEKTLGVCRRLSKNGRVKFVHEKERRGKWFALNTALKLVKDDYVAFTDADCVLERGWLRKMLAHSADIVIADYYSTSEKSLYGRLYGYGLYMVSKLSESLGVFFKSGEFSGIGSLVKSRVFKKVMFKNDFNEDWVFISSAKKCGFAVEHSNANTYQHMPSSVSDYRKGMASRMKGFMSSIGSTADPVSKAVPLVSAIIVFSLPLYIYGLIKLDPFAVEATTALLLATAVFSATSSLRDRNYRFIFYAPFIFLIVIMLAFAVVEVALKKLMRKEIKWEIYDKKEE